MESPITVLLNLVFKNRWMIDDFSERSLNLEGLNVHMFASIAFSIVFFQQPAFSSSKITASRTSRDIRCFHVILINFSKFLQTILLIWLGKKRG